ncbi:MAG: LysR family transcriptional regulator [Lachnospiraceae bacterium]|nr:LysR family transcriptional regulator [Lachnospiraceae bacterium]
MYNKHLESFIKVAETGSFSAAAEQMFISRAALIQQINLLEEHTGIQLFVRHSKGVNLTLAGEHFLTAAKSMIYVSNRTIQRCQEMQGSRSVRIGMLPNIAPHFLPNICREFSSLYPDIQVQFVEFPLERYFRSFQERKFDITMEFTLGFIYDTPGSAGLLLAHDVHCLGIPPEHPFAKKEYITEKDLAGSSIVMFPQGTSRADNALREHLIRHVKNVNIIDTVSYDRSLPLKCELSGWFLVYYARYPENFLPLVPVPLRLSVDIPIDIGLGYHADPPSSVRLFLDVAKKYGQHGELPAAVSEKKMEHFNRL